jgi:hypothetical protein
MTIKLLLEDDAYYDLRANAPPYFFAMYFATKIAGLAPLWCRISPPMLPKAIS